MKVDKCISIKSVILNLLRLLRVLAESGRKCAGSLATTYVV